jgi:hypothetical protein
VGPPCEARASRGTAARCHPAVTLGISWLDGRTAWTALLLALTTLGIAALAVPTVRRLAHGTFMPPVPPAPQPVA